jgi:uncharacterized membrane protein YGL010W
MSSKSVLTEFAAQQMEEYARFHTQRWNQISHAIGVPLIALGVLGLLGPWSVWVAILFAGSYWILDWRIAIPFTLAVAGFYRLGLLISFELAVFLFVLGWIFQWMGHRYGEKNRPAFLTHLKHLWIGPFWLFYSWISWS